MDDREVQVRAEEYEDSGAGVPAAGVLCAVTALMLVLVMLHALA